MLFVTCRSQLIFLLTKKNLLFAFLLVTLSSCSHYIPPPPHGFNATNSHEAKQSFKYATHHLKHINTQGRVSGFAPSYDVNNHPNSFYAYLAEHPHDISFYASLCYDIYRGISLSSDKHLDISAVTHAIGKEKLTHAGYKVVATFRRWQQFSGALLYKPEANTLLVVFSGTSTLKDIEMDFNITRYLKKDKHNVIDNPHYHVHGGVAQALIDSLNDFRPKFFYQLGKKALRKGDLKIITMGHSLGGGIAVLLADYLARHKNVLYEKSLHKQGCIKIQSLTFGMPRIFSPQTAREVEKRIGKSNIIRFWGSLDPIPALMSALLTNSRHVGLNFKIQDSLWRYTLPGLGWHRIGFYKKKAQHAFEKYIWEQQHRKVVEHEYNYAHQLYHRYEPKKITN